MLIDDFPRELNEFEKSKIKKSIKANLDFFQKSTLDVPVVSIPVAMPTIVLSDTVNLALGSLETWPVPLSATTLKEVLGTTPKEVVPMVRSDVRCLDFIASVFANDNWRRQYPNRTLMDLLTVISKLSPNSDRIDHLVDELVIHRELDGMSPEPGLQIVRILTEAGRPVPPQVITFAQAAMDIPLLLAVVPDGLKSGKLLIPPSLIPVMTKSELVELVSLLPACDFPHVVASTVEMVADQLSRLSFHRLVSDKEKNQLLLALFKLKTKLDSMIYVDSNPFYNKDKRFNFLGKITRTLSSEFHNAVLTLPLATVSTKMMALAGLNKLQLDTIDIVANRISSFGEKILLPSVISPSEFTCLVWAMTHHPESWKRKDRFRNSIAGPLVNGFRAQLTDGRFQPHQLVTCSKSLMSIQNKQVRLVVGEVLSAIDPGRLTNSDRLAAANIAATLLNHGDKSLLDPIIRIMESVEIARLTTPQLVDMVDICHEAKLVGRVPALTECVERRLAESGGLISPTNVARLVTSLGYLQTRGVSTLIVNLLQYIPDVSECHPRLAARLFRGIAACSVANPEIVESVQPEIESLLLTLSIPENMQQVLEQKRLAADLNKTIRLLGPAGTVFRQHLASIPASPDETQLLLATAGDPSLPVAHGDLDDIDIASDEKPTINDELESLNVEPKISRDEWTGLLPPATSLVGDLLGALMPPSNQSSIHSIESGGFQLVGPRMWRHPTERIQVTIIKANQCARDNSRHILGPAASAVAAERAEGWHVIVLPEDLVQVAAAAGTDMLKKRVRRARILCRDGETQGATLVSQFKEILNS